MGTSTCTPNDEVETMGKSLQIAFPGTGETTYETACTIIDTSLEGKFRRVFATETKTLSICIISQCIIRHGRRDTIVEFFHFGNFRNAPDTIS